MMTAKSWKAIATAMLMVVGSASQAHAWIVTPGGQVQEGDDTSQSVINGLLDDYFESLSLDLDMLYKDNVGGQEGGPAKTWYATEYFDSPSDPKDAIISWSGGSFIDSSAIYLLIKDGNQSPAWYLFDISGWNGQEQIFINDFWPGEGAISHVSIYGGTSTTTVPDGGSMAMLLGLALLGLAGTRRMLS